MQACSGSWLRMPSVVAPEPRCEQAQHPYPHHGEDAAGHDRGRDPHASKGQFAPRSRPAARAAITAWTLLTTKNPSVPLVAEYSRVCAEGRPRKARRGSAQPGRCRLRRQGHSSIPLTRDPSMMVGEDIRRSWPRRVCLPRRGCLDCEGSPAKGDGHAFLARRRPHPGSGTRSRPTPTNDRPYKGCRPETQPEQIAGSQRMSRSRRRSLSRLPPVWHVGQYVTS